MSRIVSASFVILLIFASCSSDSGNEQDSSDDSKNSEEIDETTSSTTEAADLPDLGVREGECLTVDDDGTIGESVDCGKPHALEVTGVVATPFDVIPEDFENELRVVCAETLDNYLGPDFTIGQGARTANLFLEGSVGDSVEGTADEAVGCLAQSPPGIEFEGSVADGGLSDALGKYEPVTLMETGECFELYDEFAYIGIPKDCNQKGVLLNLGNFTVEDKKYPGEDELKAIRTERCQEIAKEGDAGSGKVSGTVPSADDWEIGVRTISCDAEVVLR